jgi:hypothetical protein
MVEIRRLVFRVTIAGRGGASTGNFRGAHREGL